MSPNLFGDIFREFLLTGELKQLELQWSSKRQVHWRLHCIKVHDLQSGSKSNFQLPNQQLLASSQKQVTMEASSKSQTFWSLFLNETLPQSHLLINIFTCQSHRQYPRVYATLIWLLSAIIQFQRISFFVVQDKHWVSDELAMDWLSALFFAALVTSVPAMFQTVLRATCINSVCLLISHRGLRTLKQVLRNFGPADNHSADHGYPAMQTACQLSFISRFPPPCEGNSLLFFITSEISFEFYFNYFFSINFSLILYYFCLFFVQFSFLIFLIF